MNVHDLTITNKNIGIQAEGYSKLNIDHMSYTTTTTNGGNGLALYDSDTVINDIDIDLTCTYGSVTGIYVYDNAKLLFKKGNITGRFNEYGAALDVDRYSNVTLLSDVTINGRT